MSISHSLLCLVCSNLLRPVESVVGGDGRLVIRDVRDVRDVRGVKLTKFTKFTTILKKVFRS